MHDTTRDSAKQPAIRLATDSLWLAGPEAANALGVSLRTLQRKAASGSVERTVRGRRSLYLVSAPVNDATDDTHDATPIGDTDATDDNARHDATSDATPNPTVIELAVRLADAERRAAVAEYRVAIAETDPEVVAGLRSQVATLTAERDEAREQGQQLAAAMTKRHGLIKRLTARLANG